MTLFTEHRMVDCTGLWRPANEDLEPFVAGAKSFLGGAVDGAVGEHALIPAAPKGAKPWAIPRRHPDGAEVGKHSVNPRLVAAARNVTY